METVNIDYLNNYSVFELINPTPSSLIFLKVHCCIPQLVSNDGSAIVAKEELKKFTPEQISAMVLEKMKSIVETYAGKNVTDSDTESDIASLVGGLVGSAVGSKVGSTLTKKDGIELLIETDAGKLISIIQEISSYNYSKNQRVRIIKRNGKSRVVPFE